VRGRKPKPTAQKKLAGNPGKRKLNASEPEIPTTSAMFDSPPEELLTDSVARDEWMRSAPMLRDRKVVTDAERGALIALCQQWSIYQQAVQKWGTMGMVVKSPSGYPIVNPYMGIANKALANCLKLWSELGLTPSSRSRVQTVQTPDDADAFAEFDEVGHAATVQ
jgi:P27 family predicted phage terminase small subunit